MVRSVAREFPAALKPPAAEDDPVVGVGGAPRAASASFGGSPGPVRGGLSPVSVSATGALTLAVPGGTLRIRPDRLNRAPVARRGRAVAVLPGSGQVVRAAPLGVTTYIALGRGSPRSWTIELEGERRLVASPKGGAVVAAPRPARAGEPGGAVSRALSARERVVAVVSAPLVVAGGRARKARLRVRGSTLALEAPASDGSGVARIDWSPAGQVSRRWYAYGASTALRRSAYTIAGRRIPGLGCATNEEGTLAPGEEEQSRQLASARRGCRSLVERGTP